MALAKDPAKLAALVTNSLRLDDVGVLSEGLATLRSAIDELLAKGQPEAACAAARAGVEVAETVRPPDDDTRATVDDAKRELADQIATALLAGPADSEWHTTTMAFLLTSRKGEPRIDQIDFPVARLSADDRAHVVAELKKKASKTQGFRTALLRLGEHMLEREAYLTLARELEHPRGIVTSLIAMGRLDEAAKEAEAAIVARDAEWPLAKLFADVGKQDLAIEMLQTVADDTMHSDLEAYLAGALEAQGRSADVLELYRRRFEKRPALPNYQALRERVSKRAWAGVKAELIGELRARRLYRPLIDIAADERDIELLAGLVGELDEDQIGHATQCLASWLESGDDASAVQALLDNLASRRESRPNAPTYQEAKPVPTKVTHKKFGPGTVIGVTGTGDARKLEVEFESVGRKVLLERFLEPLG
jgi:tetratricopeptide (TPR) repeat protein